MELELVQKVKHVFCYVSLSLGEHKDIFPQQTLPH